MTTRRFLLGAAMGAGALAATARPRPAHAQAASGGAPLRLGVLTDIAGINRDLSGTTSIACTRQALADFGHAIPVEVLSADHGNKPDTGAAIVRQWFDRDGVDAVVDVPNSAVALAVAGVCRERDKVFLASGPGSVDLTGTQCSANTVHWTYDTWQLAHSTGNALVGQGGRSWYFITADYAFGLSLERETAAVVRAAGGTVLGASRVPFGTPDFSSQLLQAQSSGAQVVGFCNSGSDLINCIKQAHEFGLTGSGTRLAALLCFISDVNALGLPVAQGLVLTSTFYWDMNERTRAFTKRVLPKTPNNYPNMIHAGCYSATLHYLKAVAALGLAEAKRSGSAVVARMKSMPTDDDAFGPGSIRPDGRVLHPSYLFQVKTPAQSRGPWDDYSLLATTPADQAFRPPGEGGCKLPA